MNLSVWLQQCSRKEKGERERERERERGRKIYKEEEERLFPDEFEEERRIKSGMFLFHWTRLCVPLPLFFSSCLLSHL